MKEKRAWVLTAKLVSTRSRVSLQELVDISTVWVYHSSNGKVVAVHIIVLFRGISDCPWVWVGAGRGGWW